MLVSCLVRENFSWLGVKVLRDISFLCFCLLLHWVFAITFGIIMGIFDKPLVEKDVSWWWISDTNVKLSSNRDDKMFFIAVLINRQFSKKLLSSNLKIFKLKYKGKV